MRKLEFGSMSESLLHHALLAARMAAQLLLAAADLVFQIRRRGVQA